MASVWIRPARRRTAARATESSTARRARGACPLRRLIHEDAGSRRYAPGSSSGARRRSYPRLGLVATRPCRPHRRSRRPPRRGATPARRHGEHADASPGRAEPRDADARHVPVDELDRRALRRAGRRALSRRSQRETIRKTVKYTAAVLDDHGRDPNPARDKRVRLPHEDREELSRRPPTMSTPSTASCPTAPAAAALARLVGRARLDVDLTLSATTTSRVVASGSARSTTKTRPPLWVDLPDVLAARSRVARPARGRDPDAPLFPESAPTASDRDRDGVQGVRHPAVVTARPSSSPHLAAAPAGSLVGGDRPLRRPAEALSHRRHLHARPARRRRGRLRRDARRSPCVIGWCCPGAVPTGRNPHLQGRLSPGGPRSPTQPCENRMVAWVGCGGGPDSAVPCGPRCGPRGAPAARVRPSRSTNPSRATKPGSLRSDSSVRCRSSPGGGRCTRPRPGASQSAVEVYSAARSRRPRPVAPIRRPLHQVEVFLLRTPPPRIAGQKGRRQAAEDRVDRAALPAEFEQVSAIEHRARRVEELHG